MKVFEVGGCVRDQLLGLTPKDFDYVVVGATVEQMLDLGYQMVGESFPVFLHPVSGEEYALARTERKTGMGYHGFTCEFSPTVTLEDDLKRRDLTINAMARDVETGEIIDPYGGARDLKNRVLKHVSSHFSDDPVRAIRLARFAARYHFLGFVIDETTKSFVNDMIVAGELDHLVPERVWEEFTKAMKSDFALFIQYLHELKILHVLLPEVSALDGVIQPPQHHPEVDTFVHTVMCVQQAQRLTTTPEVWWAALMHDLGKGITPKDELPRHLMHEKRGVPLVRNVCERYKVPTSFKELALMVCEYHLDCHKVKEFKPSTLVKRFRQYDAYRKPERFEMFLLACEADARGRTGLEDHEYDQADYFRKMFEVAKSVKFADLNNPNMEPSKIQEALDRLRIQRIQQLK